MTGPVTPRSGASYAVRRARTWLPSGRSLPEHVWRSRHRGIVRLLLLHIPALVGIGALNGFSVSSSILLTVPLGVAAVVASLDGFDRRLRTLGATAGLLTASAVLVHLTNGLVESHFHFFVVVGTVMLYQDWTVFLVAFTYVLAHHGIVGSLDPEAVWNHPSAWGRPLLWAGIHGGYVAAASVAHLIGWRLNEEERARADDFAHELTLYAGELERSNEELRTADALKSDFLSRVSHELRTPLTTISGFAETLVTRWDGLDETSRQLQIQAIRRQTERLDRLVNDVLDVARIDAGVITPQARTVVVRSALGQAVGAVADGASNVDVRCPPDLRVHVDPDHLDQVVVNLVTNALKYGRAPIVVGAVPADGAVEVHVDDAGDGVPERFVDDLFERFSQASVGDTRTARGVGLGLSIVRALVEANGGAVAYQTSPMGGARFSATLPVRGPLSGAFDRTAVRTGTA